ncbi:hypothetical protein HanHA89_Chr04g0138101 [Helianthus annuus]|nr:hypothetical protein HanHA89_Chr04g0138101 [Helianthus annuus]
MFLSVDIVGGLRWWLSGGVIGVRVFGRAGMRLRPCVVVTCYNAPTMGHYSTRGNPVSMGHYSIKWCSGDNAPFNP